MGLLYFLPRLVTTVRALDNIRESDASCRHWGMPQRSASLSSSEITWRVLGLLLERRVMDSCGQKHAMHAECHTGACARDINVRSVS